MSELSKFINLLIEFSEKIEVHVNKKYKSFIRSTLNLETLAKSIKPDRILLTKELIVFKLGFEAKSPKAIQTSLTYLLRLLQLKFIDVNLPNQCQNFIIEEGGVKYVEKAEIKTEIKHEIIDLIRKNLIYKTNQINQLMVKVLEFLISEPILTLLLDISLQFPHQTIQTVIYNYFSFRFFVYEEICYYAQSQISNFTTLTLKNERTQKEIKNALHENEQLTFLIKKYMNEYLSIVQKSGGRYGNCVMCGQPADHYCKVTRASLCGIDCKKQHIEIAQKQYKHQFQSINLWEAIFSSFKELLIFLETHESPLVFGALTNLLQKPHLFMVTKQKFRNLLCHYVPNILSKALDYKKEAFFYYIYTFVISLAKYWLKQCLSPIEYFFKEYIIKVLQDKKPTLKFLNLIFKALARIFEYGKVTIQLYINFDCEVNKQNLIEKILFEIAKISQDRFSNNPIFNKQEKTAIKNHCLSLFIIMVMGLNQYRKQCQMVIETSQIIVLKQKKISLEQFATRFNEHWTSGLKTLFNLNLVGLDSNEEIIDILMNLKGLNKQNIDQLFFCQKGVQLFEIFITKIMNKNKNSLLMSLLELHHYIPLKVSSIGVKKFLEKAESFHGNDIEKRVVKWMDFLSKPYNLEQLKKAMQEWQNVNLTPRQYLAQYTYALQTKHPLTQGNSKAYFTYCCSKSYLQVIGSQITLLQIPISYFLETDYQTDRVIALIEELIQVCAHSNWTSLLIKNTAIGKYPTDEFDETKLKLVLGVMSIVQKQAFFIQDWSTIINFFAFLYHAILKPRSSSAESKVILHQEIVVGKIERCLAQASVKSQVHFNKFLLAILVVGKQELEKDCLFMVQKFFEILELNSKKFILIAEAFIPYLNSFIKQIQHFSSQICISIADMLKQTFAKLLKLPKPNDNWVNNCEAQFWKLFQCLCESQNREVNDFVVNCISMSVLNHYELSYKSWVVLFGLMKRKVGDYRQQVYTIIEKIVNEKLRNCQQFYSDLVKLCLQLIHPTQTKISIESLHVLKSTLDIVIQIKMGSVKSQDIEEDLAKQQIKKLLMRVIQNLTECLFYNCHQYIIEHIFKLLKCKINSGFALAIEDMHIAITSLFEKVQQFTPETLMIAEKTINYSLNWSVSHKYENIIKCLEGLVIGKYNNLSFSATKCIKTYIQMVNPRQQQWILVISCLLNILNDSKLSNSINLQLSNRFLDYSSPLQLNDAQAVTDVGLLGNKMLIQKAVIDILPNHIECLDTLMQLYDEIINFNDNLYLRVLLWRRGLGGNWQRAPDLLAVEEAISSKLAALLGSIKQEGLFDFTFKLFSRYCQSSALLASIQLNQSKRDEYKQDQTSTMLCEYLRTRKVPLLRVILYFLPKLNKICCDKQTRKKMALQLVQSCKYVQSREPILKALRQLTV